ncbi:DUF4345 domain-containing protein [Winogradskyella tangerina]|uniref:DUF4345 domain-containing protein n=1 Tax=Winogradskyella tangerina TaxID=2023240 RepID=UPI000DBE9933|nr:DUF4345 domain-containing protein [Winogradskyella tangerina]
MKLSPAAVITKIHLVISICVVIPAAIIYGFDFGDFLNLNFNTIDEQNFSKAVMCLYIGFSILWILGILKSAYLKSALISNMVFMLALSFGRILSIIIDGLPSEAYIYGTFGELVLGSYGVWLLNSKYLKKS